MQKLVSTHCAPEERLQQAHKDLSLNQNLSDDVTAFGVLDHERKLRQMSGVAYDRSRESDFRKGTALDLVRTVSATASGTFAGIKLDGSTSSRLTS
jgi:hypothetical protein